MLLRSIIGPCRLLAPAAALLALVAAAGAQEPGREDEALQKAAQNPIANLISVPLQNNTNFNFGPRERTQNVLNFQPVIPITLTPDWNLITRTIVPIIRQPALDRSDTSDTGLGDINPSAFFATNLLPDLMVGFGPTLTIPTATDDDLGNRRWAAGPTAVAVWLPGHWVVGALANNQWSFAGRTSGKSVNQMLIQPFVNYNLPDGWAVASSPVITANWKADEDKDIWTVPVGGGVSKLLRVGKLPVELSAQGYYNVEKPEFGADWTLRLQVSFLFPK